MTYQKALEQLVAALKTIHKGPVWVNLVGSDLYSVFTLVNDANNALGGDRIEEVDSITQIAALLEYLGGNYTPNSEEEVDLFDRLVDKDYYVCYEQTEKSSVFATNIVLQFFKTHLNKGIITFNLEVSPELQENIISIQVPFLSSSYAPSTIIDALESIHGGDKGAREAFLKDHGIEIIQPLDAWTLGGWDLFKSDMKEFSHYKKIEKQLDTEILLKGSLLVGVPGTGKSLAAKIVGSYFEWPVIKFNIGSLLSKWVGESDKLFQRFMYIVEAVAPVVVYMDEIEKMLHTSTGDPVTPRLIGNLLTWMQDTPKDVYVIATANAVFGSNFTAPLPPELLRRGRFDELYFADIPPFEEQLDIVGVFFRRYKIAADVEKIDKDKFRKLAKNFTGAELEDAVKKAYIRHVIRKGNYYEHFYNVLQEIVPIARVHGSYIAALRKYAIEKFKPVSSLQKEQLFSLVKPSSSLQINYKKRGDSNENK